MTTLSPVNLTTGASVADLQAQLRPWFDRLRATSPELDVPSPELADLLTAALWSDRGGKLRVRKSAPANSSPVVRATFGLYRWHGAGGSLEGLFIAKWNAGHAWPQVETYVTVLLAAFGARSRALGAWARTGLFGGAS